MPDPQPSYLDLDGLRYYNNKVSGFLNNKVDKVNGKGLSTNDYTNNEQSKLSNIEANAQVNIIEAITVNGTAQTITSKNVNISVPTNNNQLTNGAGYQTSSDVNTAIGTALGSYSTTSEVNTAIATAVANSQHLTKELVDTLPVTGADNVIYLVPNSTSGNNVKDEYMWINNAWEKTGSSDIDLSGYMLTASKITNAEIDAIVGS